MHNGGGSEKHVTVPSAVAGPRTGPVCRAMYPVLIDMADQSVTESQDSQTTLTEWGPVEHAETWIVERTSFPLEIRIGEERFGYVYTLHFPSGVYRCERGSDYANAGDRLFLYKETFSPPRP